MVGIGFTFLASLLLINYLTYAQDSTRLQCFNNCAANPAILGRDETIGACCGFEGRSGGGFLLVGGDSCIECTNYRTINANVDIITDPKSPSIGVNLTLTCQVTTEELLRPTGMIFLQLPNGTVITDTIESSTLNFTLQLNPFSFEDKGKYYCNISITSPEFPQIGLRTFKGITLEPSTNSSTVQITPTSTSPSPISLSTDFLTSQVTFSTTQISPMPSSLSLFVELTPTALTSVMTTSLLSTTPIAPIPTSVPSTPQMATTTIQTTESSPELPVTGNPVSTEVVTAISPTPAFSATSTTTPLTSGSPVTPTPTVSPQKPLVCVIVLVSNHQGFSCQADKDSVWLYYYTTSLSHRVLFEQGRFRKRLLISTNQELVDGYLSRNDWMKEYDAMLYFECNLGPKCLDIQCICSSCNSGTRHEGSGDGRRDLMSSRIRSSRNRSLLSNRTSRRSPMRISQSRTSLSRASRNSTAQSRSLSSQSSNRRSFRSRDKSLQRSCNCD